ncbi:zeta toxin family protein [Pseudomonas sp. xss_2]|uniref:zeta toxin family protein n=1 Tax=Pseudomonas sp. xss_2 TaxID=3367215 RepID=UPI00370CB85D
MSTQYPFSTADVQNAFEQLQDSLFDKTREIDAGDSLPSPKILILAGAQGSGKTYLLENTLLPSGRYENYVRLYLPSFRELHPSYQAMKPNGVLHVYEHTEDFIWRLGEMICTYALENKYNIIMETALDNPAFAEFPPAAANLGYQFEVHVIACQKELSHWASLDRVVKSVAKGELERVVTLTQIEEAQANARKILDAFENACTQKVGSQIVLYLRGMETDMESRPVCYSTCNVIGELAPQQNYLGQAFVYLAHLSFKISRNARESFPCSYIQYSQVVHAGLMGMEVRQKMAAACCKTLGKAQITDMPTAVFRELCLYVLRYVNP